MLCPENPVFHFPTADLSRAHFPTASNRILRGKSRFSQALFSALVNDSGYVTDGGNLTLEFTIQAADVRGASQVFSSSFAFGTVPLQVIQ